MSGSGEKILLDAHVHLRDCFNVIAFSDNACANFRDVARRLDGSDRFSGVLFLANAPGERGFQRIEDAFADGSHVDSEEKKEWNLRDTQERSSCCLISEEGDVLFIVDGCQVVSREHLEVLAVGTHEHFGGRRPVATLIQDIAQVGAIPILPWGAGKWVGARGQVIERLLQISDLPQFFLGDSANRPTFWPQPSLFRRAEERGIRNLLGSDPLPFPGEVQRVGSFGVAMEGGLDLDTPTEDLKERLLDSSTTFHPFGQRETPLRFVRNQLKMQLRKLTQ